MKTIFPFLKSLSRTVHGEGGTGDRQESVPSARHTNDRQEEEESMSEGSTDVKLGPCKSLTVWRKSLLLSCKGFTVIDSSGSLVYRVDNYSRHRPQEMTLMDAAGNSVLTMRLHKKPGIWDRWLIYEGEVGDDSIRSGKKPFCCVRKQINVLRNARSKKILAYVSGRESGSSQSRAFVIKGSYMSRSCEVVEEETHEVVAEVRRKEETVRGVSFGLEVFVLVVQPGFDAGFAMALVLLLDQMFS